MTTHYEKIQALGNRMASNLETMGVSASFSDGGLTLADKILEIQQFTDGLLLWADKDIIQTGDTVNFCALLLEDKKAVSGETVFFYDLNNPPITRSSAQTHTLNVELGSSFKLIYQSSSTYGERIMLSNEDDSLLIEYSGYNNNVYISINGGVPVTAFSCEGFLKLENGVLSDDGGHTYNLSSYNLNFKLKEMQTVGNNCSVYINPIGSAVTGANGVATVSYTGVGAGNLNVQAKTIDGSSQSGIYELWDYLCYDGGVTGDKSSDWTASSGITVSTDDTGTLLSASTTQTYVSNKLLTGDFEATFQATNVGSIRIGFNKASDQSVQTKIITPTGDNTYYYKINRIGSTWRFQYSSDGVNWTDRSISVNNITTEDCYFLFSIEVSGSTRTIKYKDLKIYKI